MPGSTAANADREPVIGQVQGEVSNLLSNYPELQRFIRLDGPPPDLSPMAMNVLGGVGSLSLSLLAALALTIIFFSTIA